MKPTIREPNLGWGLPPGVSDRDIDGQEERGEDGLTERERRREQWEEDKEEERRLWNE